MKNNRKTIIISVISVLLGLFLIVGLSYAYVIADIIGDPEGITGTFANIRIEYSDNDKIEGVNIVPGWTDTKTIVITNLGDTTNYDLNFVELVNTFQTGYLTYTVISEDGGCNIPRTSIPYGISTSTTRLICSNTIENEGVHTYEIKLEYLKYDENGVELNHSEDISKNFSAYIQVGETKNTIFRKILSNNIPQSDVKIDFAQISSDTNGNGLYFTNDLAKTEDIDGDGVGEMVYYYRGRVENNYVLFGGFCWRIVRTNEDGSVRIRFGGSPVEGVCPQTGNRVSITGVSTGMTVGTAFNNVATDIKYIGYTYDNGSDSNIKSVIESWYENNIWKDGQNTAVTDLIVSSTFCNDKGINEESDETVYYNSVYRASINSPQYRCDSDKYTLTSGLKYPIGLLTADEIMYAGGVYNYENISFYLNTGGSYWTMTPYYFDGNSSHVWNLLSEAELSHSSVVDGEDVVPVLSINANSIVTSGIGTYNNPYIINGLSEDA